MFRRPVAYFAVAALSAGVPETSAKSPATQSAPIEQAVVERAMQRMRVRQAIRSEFTTRPAPASVGPGTKTGVHAYSDSDVEKFRKAFVAGQVSVSRSAAKAHDPKTVQKAVEARRAVSAASV
jgi:hypothetical protein